MIDNITMSIDANMLIKIVLWLSKHAYSNNHKHKLTTQHLKSIIRTIKTWYVEIAIIFSQLHMNTLYTKLFYIKRCSRKEMIIELINIIEVIIAIIILNSEGHIQSMLANNHQPRYKTAGHYHYHLVLSRI